jgi:hypothetical protein
MPNMNINNKEEDFNYIEAVKADNNSLTNYFSTWKMNSEFAFYQKELFNSPQLWNSNFFMSEEAMYVPRSLMDAWLPDFKFGPGKCALIMPNHVECCTKPVLERIARNMPEVPINIMDQYYPDNLCDPSSSKYRERYSEIARSPTKEEIITSYPINTQRNWVLTLKRCPILRERPLAYSEKLALVMFPPGKSLSLYITLRMFSFFLLLSVFQIINK